MSEDASKEFEKETLQSENIEAETVESKDEISAQIDKKIKKKKRNTYAAIAVFALILAGGVLGNWYYDNSDISATINPLIESVTNKTLGEAELVDANAKNEKESSYFSSARLERQNTRDEALDNLNKIITSTDEDESAHKKAAEDISLINKYMSIENKIETLVCAKGINNCLAIIDSTGERVDVIVDVETLDETILVQIKDIATAQLGCTAKNVSIIQSNK